MTEAAYAACIQTFSDFFHSFTDLWLEPETTLIRRISIEICNQHKMTNEYQNNIGHKIVYTQPKSANQTLMTNETRFRPDEWYFLYIWNELLHKYSYSFSDITQLAIYVPAQ